jgi:hypothetical protein
MTCRAACAPPLPKPLASVFRELAEAGRWDDFRWLARSHGLTTERTAELWQHLLARTRHSPPSIDS